MNVFDLTREELTELKENYLTQHLLEVENRDPSYNELVTVDLIIPDDIIYENYSGSDFSKDDFFCNL